MKRILQSSTVIRDIHDAVVSSDEIESKGCDEVRFAHPRGAIKIELAVRLRHRRSVAGSLRPNRLKHGPTHILECVHAILGAANLKRPEGGSGEGQGMSLFWKDWKGRQVRY